MTVILGAYLGHDANFCLVRDGVVLGCVEAERTTRRKHQEGLQRAVLDGFLSNVQEPIVDTPEQARATFARSGIDVLYVNGVRLSK